MVSRHIELESQIDKVRLTLEEPDLIYYSPSEDNHHYYRQFKETPVREKYLLVVTKHLDDDGFVITGFFIDRLRTQGKVLAYERQGID